MSDQEQGGGTPQEGRRGETSDEVEPRAFGTPRLGGIPDHGTPPPYGTPTYGTPTYGTAPGYGPLRSPEASSLRTQAIFAMILNIVAVLMCCLPVGIVGAVTAGIAISRVDTDVARARSLVRWSWGLLLSAVLIGVAAFAAFFVLIPVIGTLS